jgi:sugar phosphate permease
MTFLGFAFVLPSIWWFILVFSLAGLFIAWEDTVEGIAVRDYVDKNLAGTAYGILEAVNGMGDFVSSLLVGLLWTMIGPAWGFGYAVLAGLLGMALMFCTNWPKHARNMAAGI